MDLSILIPIYNTISSIIIVISEPESNTMAGILKCLILHFIVTMLIDSFFFRMKSIFIGLSINSLPKP